MANSVKIPKPIYKACDETSITISWPPFNYENSKLGVQYKEPHVEWSDAKVMDIEQGTTELTVFEFADLKPGTPYFVRLIVKSDTGDVKIGPETVIDTKPIDCTPKKKTCLVM